MTDDEEWPTPAERAEIERHAKAALASGRVTVHAALQGWQEGWIDDARAIELTDCESVQELYRSAIGSDVEIKLPPRPIVVSVPGIMSGDPCIMGTRVLAETVLAEIKVHRSEPDILDDYPTLPAGVVNAVLDWEIRRRAARADPERAMRLLREFVDEDPERDELD